MKVKIIAHTEFPEETIAKSAKLCYSRVGVDEISEKLDEDSTNKFLNMLMGFSHMSPLEHASFTFAVEEISLIIPICFWLSLNGYERAITSSPVFLLIIFW